MKYPGQTYILVLILLLTSAITLPAIELSGELGLDLESYKFSSDLKDTTRSYSINRRQSNHFLNINFGGPVVNKNFATLNTRSSIFGTYYEANTDSDKTHRYFAPKLHTYSGIFSLFPARPYSLLFQTSKSFDYSLRYEANNRSELELRSPELAVVRRYENELKSRGVSGKWAVAENITFSTNYHQDEMKSTRNYDFGENKDIWIDFNQLFVDTTINEHYIDIINTIKDDSVLIIIDVTTVFTLISGGSISVLIGTGIHSVDFIPYTKYNQYRTNVKVSGDQTWKIKESGPAPPNDIGQTTTVYSSELKIKSKKNITNDTYFEYSDAGEEIQDMRTFLSSFNNNFRYDIAQNNSLQMLTSYTKNQTRIDTISDQKNTSLMHQTTLSLSRRGGITNTFSHSINKMTSRNDDEQINSLNNIFINRTIYKFRKYDYTIDWRNSATLISDSLLQDNIVGEGVGGHRGKQLLTDLTNRMKFFIGGVAMVPQYQIKYSYNKQENPDLRSKELENRLSLETEIDDIAVLGDLKIKGEFDSRNRKSNNGTDNKKRYLIDLNLARSFSKNYKLSILSSYEKETYGGTVPTAGSNEGQIDAARKPQNKFLYKIDLVASPFGDFMFNANLAKISQESSKISRFGATLIFTIPVLNIPVKSFLLSESRDIGTFETVISGSDTTQVKIPAQVQTTWETKMIFRFRKIALVLSHRYAYENLITNKYKYFEIRGKISRQFNVF